MRRWNLHVCFARRRALLGGILATQFLLAPPSVRAEAERVPKGIAVTQQTGVLLPWEVRLLDEQGQATSLQKISRGKPVLVIPGYYECPRLCGLMFSSARDVMREAARFGLVAGRDYRVASISFSQRDTVAAAKKQGDAYRPTLGLAAGDWPFLRGSATDTARLLSAAGYNYRPDGSEFSHSAALIVLTPDGRVSRYLDGLNVLSRDFRFALIEASGGRIGSATDRVFQMCFRWDNAEGRYAPVAWAFIRIGGLLTLITLAGLILFLKLSERNT